MGNFPTLVSPESISASAPSSTALATSDASARVGREVSIIDSSIWVATITGLAARRARVMASVCTSGTSSSGSSTPRSPRATMMPSNASTISARLSTACGFSTFASTGRCTPSASMMARTSLTSSAERTKDRATRSACRRSAQRRSSLSFSDMAGTLTATPGRLIPLWLDTRPPSTTLVTTRGPSTAVHSRATLPSSMSSRSPGRTSPGRPSYVVPTSCTSPGTSSVVMVNVAPLTRSTGPDANVPTRIFGPWRSTRIATPRPDSSEAFRTCR